MIWNYKWPTKWMKRRMKCEKKNYRLSHSIVSQNFQLHFSFYAISFQLNYLFCNAIVTASAYSLLLFSFSQWLFDRNWYTQDSLLLVLCFWEPITVILHCLFFFFFLVFKKKHYFIYFLPIFSLFSKIYFFINKKKIPFLLGQTGFYNWFWLCYRFPSAKKSSSSFLLACCL